MGVTVTIPEIVKAKNIPYFYSIIGFLFGFAILILLPKQLQPEYVMLGIIFFFNFIDIARKRM